MFSKWKHTNLLNCKNMTFPKLTGIEKQCIHIHKVDKSDLIILYLFNIILFLTYDKDKRNFSSSSQTILCAIRSLESKTTHQNKYLDRIEPLKFLWKAAVYGSSAVEQVQLIHTLHLCWRIPVAMCPLFPAAHTKHFLVLM